MLYAISSASDLRYARLKPLIEPGKLHSKTLKQCLILAFAYRKADRLGFVVFRVQRVGPADE